MQVAVEFRALVVGQFAGLRPFGQLAHAINVATANRIESRYSAASGNNSPPGFCMSLAQVPGSRFAPSILRVQCI